MIDEGNYEQWAMDYIEGTLGAELRRDFDAFLAGHPFAAEQIASLADGIPVLPPETAVFPDKASLLRGRRIVLARRQERLQRFGAMASGAAAAAVLFGGLLFFRPGEGAKGPARIASEAAEAYPEGAEALAARFDRESAAENRRHAAEDSGTENADARPGVAAVPSTGVTGAAHAMTARHALYRSAAEPAAERRATPAAGVRPGVGAEATASSAQPAETTAHPVSSAGAGVRDGELQAEGVLGSLSKPAELYLPEPTWSTPPIVTLPVGTPAPRSLIAHRIEATRNETARTAARDDGGFRSSLGSLLSTLNDLSPVSRYNTTEESGVTIASFIHISKLKSAD